MAEKKVWDQPLTERQRWTELNASVPLLRQCQLLKVTRSVIYEQKKRLLKETDKDELVLLRLLDEEYTRHPFYGSRRMKKYLGECGYSVNRKRVQRLMQKLGLVGMSPGPNTSNRIRSAKFIRTDSVALALFSSIRCGALTSSIFGYPADLFIWSRSSTGTAGKYCRGDYRIPWILGFAWTVWKGASRCMAHRPFSIPTKARNSPATPLSVCCSRTASRSVWTDICSCNICISHIHVDHGRGRALDNIFVERLWRTVKYEEVYLKQHSNMPDLLMGLAQYFQFYNQERWHQALAYKTPDEVYKTAMGGEAKIVDKFNGTGETSDPVLQNWDSAIQLECEQSSILN